MFIFWVVLPFAAAAVGSLFPPDVWYKTLRKPRWNPPNWIFPVAWTLLYLLMGIAAAITARAPHSASALVVFCVQLALNALWTPVVFGKHSLGTGLVVIVALWVAIGATVNAFFAVSSLAGLLLLPYWAWVTFATALNAELWRIN
jgi:benzodiazapine receptor